MGLETTVFYPFHPLCGSTLAVVNRGKEAVTVATVDERRLKIPLWMTRPDAVGYTVSEEATIDLPSLLMLSHTLKPSQPLDHGTLCEPETTPAAGGEDEAVGACALYKELESERDAAGHGDAGEARSVDGGDDCGGRAREQEGR